MKIAVATDNGKSISPHFGKSKGLLIYEAKDGRLEVQASRPFDSLPGGNAGCRGGEVSRPEEGSHGHAGLIAQLQGCQAVICRGMGRKAIQELDNLGIQHCIIADDLNPEEAVRAFLAGDLKSTGQSCLCHQKEL